MTCYAKSENGNHMYSQYRYRQHRYRLAGLGYPSRKETREVANAVLAIMTCCSYMSVQLQNVHMCLKP